LDSSVGTVTRLLARQRRICGPIPGRGQTSLVVKTMQAESGAHPTTYPVGTGKGGEALTPWVKWPEHETDHSPSSRAEAKNEWSYTSSPAICLHGMDRNNFTFTSNISTYIYKQQQKKRQSNVQRVTTRKTIPPGFHN